ncbi:MAG: PilT/PilU family type 4a pilus ATPase [Myxococcales bacterium]
MQFDKLFQLLERSDVKELALQSERPPCALIGEQYAPVVKRNFSEEDVIGALVAAGGRAEVISLIEGQRRWEYQHPTLGLIRVTAGYHGDKLQARFKLLVPAEGRKPQAAAGPLDLQGFGDESTGSRPKPENAAPAAAQAKPPEPRAAPRAPAPPPLARPAGVAAAPGPLPHRPGGAPAPNTGAIPAPAAAPSPTAPLAATPGAPAPAAPSPAPAPSVQAAPAPPPRVRLGSAPAEIFESLLKLSREQRASDLHVLGDRSPTLRIAGDLVPVADPLSASVVAEMLLNVVPASVRADLDQHGACDFPLLHPTLGRFRANVTRQRSGYKLTARPIRDTVPTLEELGLPKSIANATHHHQGLIVVTGPTGHGKTTTLAAIVDLINREHTHHIISVEDPIEYVHPPKRSVISQRQVGAHTKTFAAALKGSLREDPDVIVVGELRDTETVRMALSASETGHLVISTMNTPSAAKAIERLIDLFPPGDQPQVRMTLAGGLRLIISQRLVPTADRTDLVAAAELLPGSSPLWALIRDNKTFQIPSLQQRGKAIGIVRLDDSLAELVRTGRTSLEIAREFAEAPDQFDALVTQALNPAAAKPAQFDPTGGSLGKDLFSKAGKIFGNDRK